MNSESVDRQVSSMLDSESFNRLGLSGPGPSIMNSESVDRQGSNMMDSESLDRQGPSLVFSWIHVFLSGVDFV